MERTVKDKVTAKIKSAPKGKLFIISDFESLGSYASVRKILYELEKADLLKREILFRHVTQREVWMNPTSSLVVEAFKALGKDGVTDDVLKQVKSKLFPKQLAQLSKNVGSSRIWIREKVRRMNEVLE